MLLAVIRRTMKGMSPFDADRQHLHHRLLNMGHSHRQSVLLMYLWAALFSGLVVGLSVLRISLIWFALITLAAIAALLLATAPKLRPWHGGGKRERGRGSRARSDGPAPATPDLAAPVSGTAPGAPAGPFRPGHHPEPAAGHPEPRQRRPTARPGSRAPRSARRRTADRPACVSGGPPLADGRTRAGGTSGLPLICCNLPERRPAERMPGCAGFCGDHGRGFPFGEGPPRALRDSHVKSSSR